MFFFASNNCTSNEHRVTFVRLQSHSLLNYVWLTKSDMSCILRVNNLSLHQWNIVSWIMLRAYFIRSEIQTKYTVSDGVDTLNSLNLMRSATFLHSNFFAPMKECSMTWPQRKKMPKCTRHQFVSFLFRLQCITFHFYTLFVVLQNKRKRQKKSVGLYGFINDNVWFTFTLNIHIHFRLANGDRNER